MQDTKLTTISSTEAQSTFGGIIRRACKNNEHFLVERAGIPVVVILSLSDYKALIQKRERYFQTSDD